MLTAAIEDAVTIADAQGLTTVNWNELGDAAVFVMDVVPYTAPFIVRVLTETL